MLAPMKGIKYVTATMRKQNIRIIKNNSNKIMEDGGVDSTVIESQQHKIGQMADFPPLLASSVFDS